MTFRNCFDASDEITRRWKTFLFARKMLQYFPKYKKRLARINLSIDGPAAVDCHWTSAGAVRFTVVRQCSLIHLSCILLQRTVPSGDNGSFVGRITACQDKSLFIIGYQLSESLHGIATCLHSLSGVYLHGDNGECPHHTPVTNIMNVFELFSYCFFCIFT